MKIELAKNLCTGCTACAEICPKQCISMVHNSEGFLYPKIDTTACVECRLCEKTCQVLHKSAPNEVKPATFAAYSKDLDNRLSSSSGGIFSLLANKILNEGGVVYGVAMAEDCYSAEFVRVVDEEGLSCLRGSKYFQARMNGAYNLVKEDLNMGRMVLFSGTACQINGLLLFLGKSYDSLFCVDVICHGVPSPKLWQMYAKDQEARHGKIRSVNFRCKDNGWKNFGMKENNLYIPMQKDPFMRMFLRDYCLRTSCYECVAKQDKKSDLTIADFWGIEKVAPEMNDGKGTSVVILRTNKGAILFDAVKKEMMCKEVKYDDAVKENPSDYCSVKRPPFRDTFFDDMNTVTFSELSKKYASEPKISLIIRVKRLVKAVIYKLGGGKL